MRFVSRQAGLLLGTAACSALIFVVSACTSRATATAGSTQGRAGVIVRHSDGSTVTVCIPFAGEDVTGEEVLLQSGLEVRMDMANALGSLVCSVDGEGCAFPEEACLCECDRPGACGYWAYFSWDETGQGWIYNSQGARLRRLGDGALDAWVWLESRGPEEVAAALPEGIAFEDVCPGE
jgi:hypothetical protein